MDLSGVEKFLKTVAALRDPVSGCPWDLAQTHESLAKYFEEEVLEFLEALTRLGPASGKTWEELGDVLLQVGLHTQLAAEKNLTDFNRVCEQAADKLIRRHPHVFDPAAPRFKDAAEVNAAWGNIKQQEKGAPKNRSAQLEDIPTKLSGLRRAARLGQKAASFGFDWPDAAEVLKKVEEEVGELKSAPADAEELGDLFFALAQYARKQDWDPEQILARANEKFTRRFAAMEESVRSAGLDWERLTLDELERHWQSIKVRENS